MKRLQKCCCCASTRTGTLVTAFLGVILSIATIIIVWVVERHRITFSTLIFDKDFDKKLSDLDSEYLIGLIIFCWFCFEHRVSLVSSVFTNFAAHFFNKNHRIYKSYIYNFFEFLLCKISLRC